jgi:hypothetical protein
MEEGYDPGVMQGVAVYMMLLLFVLLGVSRSGSGIDSSGPR